MKLKVCGMKYQDNINQVAALQPNYLGFIFYEKSSRYFNDNIPKISNSIKKIGVFVDADLNEVIEKINKYNLQAVQLHGNESPEFCKSLQSKDVEIIKVFSIKDEFNFAVLKPYETVCDYYLFDTKGKLPGGNGYTFNWSVLNNYPSTKPFFLSGGIGLEEMESVLSFLRKQESRYCYAIDVNSKFEIEPGLKNIKKLDNFMNQINAKH
ncbi:MAG: phosphoribosylanthranilate isomerase [Bacteroidetes bacterium]|nr:MAG: phosphoribosylanthranilate isomerase [Bacteroidota bacterium]